MFFLIFDMWEVFSCEAQLNTFTCAGVCLSVRLSVRFKPEFLPFYTPLYPLMSLCAPLCPSVPLCAPFSPFVPLCAPLLFMPIYAPLCPFIPLYTSLQAFTCFYTLYKLSIPRPRCRACFFMQRIFFENISTLHFNIWIHFSLLSPLPPKQNYSHCFDINF